MKSILLMAVSVLMFNSTSFGQAMQSVEMAAETDLLAQKLETLEKVVAFLPQGQLFGRHNLVGTVCTAQIAVFEKDQGINVTIKKSSLLDLLGTQSKTLASVTISPLNQITGEGNDGGPTMTEKQVTIGTAYEETRNMVTITKSADGKRATVRVQAGDIEGYLVDESCEVKIK